MENKSEKSKKSKNNDSPKLNGKKPEPVKDQKLQSKFKKILSTQCVSDIISVNRWWEKENLSEETDKKWDSLEHNGVIFPPRYIPHGVKILFKGEPISLTPYQEELSSYWASILDNDMSTKDICKKNFFAEFKQAMGKTFLDAKFEDFDFTPIKDYLGKQKEINKNKSKEEKRVRIYVIY